MAAERFGREMVAVVAAINPVAGRKDDFRQTVAVEVVDNQWIDEVGLFRGRDLLGQNRTEWRLASARPRSQATRVNAPDRRRCATRRPGRPVHDQVTLQNGALPAGRI